MRIFLSGLMGTGKTTVGKALSERTDLPLVDLDQVLTQQLGSSIADYFRQHGEAAFRARERAAVEKVLAEHPLAIIALGGGAVADRATRRLLLRAGYLITLDASDDELARRLESGEGRPLLEGGPVRERIAELRRARAEAYAECHLRVDTTVLEPEKVARAVWEGVSEEPIVVPMGLATYRVFVGNHNRHKLALRVQDLGPVSSMLLVSDTTVGPAWARSLSTQLRSLGQTVTHLELAPGESEKTLESVDTIWNAALDVGIDRSSLVVGVGGGVIGDLAGFAAATLLRGVRVAHVPTTLLSMVDSAIGGKTGFDTRHGKNLIGAFHQPSFVLSDIHVLSSLARDERRAGLAEVVKSAWIEGEAAVAQLEADAEALARGDEDATTRAIRMAVKLKARIVSEDERESGLRAHLNLGHTLAHSIEASSGYAGIRHGEAVALGMVAASRVATTLGHMQPEDAQRAERLLDRVGLPTRFEPYLTDRVLSFLSADKKRKGAKVSFVAPGRPGDTTLVPLKVEELTRLFKSFAPAGAESDAAAPSEPAPSTQDDVTTDATT
ncbi:MAG: 3-dehydroquinate synthase [Polyangiales bacterium]